MSASTAIKALNDHSLHYCKFTCNVCNTPQCHMQPKKWIQCEDCTRYCRSEFCFEMHKQPQSDGLRSRCDLVKHCNRCCRQYRAKWSGDKLLSHTCAASKCPHCSDVLLDEGHHSCYIKPLKHDEHSDKYIYFDFETMHENGKRTANYMCAVSQKGAKCLQLKGLVA